MLTQQLPTIPSGLLPILDPALYADSTGLRIAEEILAGGARWLMLRAKEMPQKNFLALARELAYLKVHNPLQLILNSHVDLVCAVGADGVHLPASIADVAGARSVLGPEKIIGVSVHSVEEGVVKASAGADYLLFGAIYPTTTKGPDHPIQGLEKLKALVASVTIPVIAIGGITPACVPEILATGAHGFAAMTGILTQENLQQATQAYLQAILTHV